MQEFLEFFNYLIQNCKEPVVMSDEVKRIYDLLQNQKEDKPLFTETGLAVLEYLQGAEASTFKAKDIAEGMEVNARKVSGSMRKLTTDGYVEKLASKPAIYALTEKGKNVNVEDYKN